MVLTRPILVVFVNTEFCKLLVIISENLDLALGDNNDPVNIFRSGGQGREKRSGVIKKSTPEAIVSP